MFRITGILLVLLGSALAFAQDKSAQVPPPPSKQARRNAPIDGPKPAAPRKKFVLDVVRNAVALPQPSQQDRLRVLHSAVMVVGPLDSQLAKQYSREGVRIEAELIGTGQKPVASMFDGGHVDCAMASQFVERIPAEAVARAEDSLIAAISTCSNTAVEPARQKLQMALEQHVLAPRALMAVMDRVGPGSAWSQAQFRSLFASLPTGKDAVKEAPNYGAMLSEMAKSVDQDTIRDAGLKFLDWLGKFDAGGERNLAVNMATQALKETLGDKKYEEALRSDIMARQVADTAGQAGEITPPEEESVSVLGAMGKRGTDRSDELQKMPASLRAREAAASGFASGTGGDKKGAERYFDVAFSAADEVWSARDSNPRAAEVVEEVSQAAAQVDPVGALVRTQKLQDPSSQAIGMLAVARVVEAQ